MTSVHSIKAKIESGELISRQDALFLYNDVELLELGMIGRLVRDRLHPGRKVSFLIDRNINYTNVCNSDCTFCGFYRHDPKHPESYVISREAIGEKIEEALKLGATRILLQGGHNDELSYDYYLGLIDWIHKTYPAIEINSFSPSEIAQMRKVSGKTTRDILLELKSLGMAGLPGGGAEMLDDDVRIRVSPKKIRSSDWIETMAIAHEVGLTTTSTMVIGFGETREQRLNHMERLRDLQVKSIAQGYRGFNAFISWTLQMNEATAMGRSRHRDSYGASSIEYLRNLAVARIFMSNIPHHQASWPTLGADVAMMGLHFGCNDIGSTMMEENVVSKAGALTKNKWSMSPEELCGYVRAAGFEPVQRNSSFEIVKAW